MRMWDEAPKTELFGGQIYTFGLYCLIGAAAAVAAVLILCRHERMEKGTGGLLSLLSIVLGTIVSRLFFSVLYSVSADGFPLFAWFRISSGGWSLYGMICGVFAAAWICAKITGDNSGKTLDAASCALPLMIAAERFGERYFDGFDVSRPLRNGAFPGNTFLAVGDTYYEDISFLATYLVAAIASLILFLTLVLFLTRRQREDGDLWILFMILCGAGGIMLESLRYDHFLEYSFVCFQQILAAVLLITGVVVSGIRNRGAHKGMTVMAYISLPLAIGMCGGIEYALDRTTISHYLLYAVMFSALAVPVILGILLLRNRKKGIETA